MTCPFCLSLENEVSKLPRNFFNNKSFLIHVCKSCRLYFVDPIPNADDLKLMYPSSYQNGVANVDVDSHKKLPGLRVAHQNIFDKLTSKKSDPKILDFGCGNGAFVYNALKKGFNIEGVEFGKEQVELLKKDIPKTKFYLISEFLESHNKYDVIYLSNVFEHFTNCRVQFEEVLSHLQPGGIVIVEGPLEKNRSLVNYCKWNYFIMRKVLRRSYTTSFPPVHIFYSNYKNQLGFFDSYKLKKIYYASFENSWPYPETINDINGPMDAVKWLIAKASKFFSGFIGKYGNTFVYVGEK